MSEIGQLPRYYNQKLHPILEKDCAKIERENIKNEIVVMK